jgi:hypothetical protein
LYTPLKTILWRTVIAAAIVILIISCFYAEENARGLRAWRMAERDVSAHGGTLDWNHYIPPPVADDQNFFQAPMMTDWFVRSTNASATGASATTSLSTLMTNPETFTNLITDISASNYVAWSASFEPQLGQIRDALKRPAARINGDYSQSFLQPIPNFVSYRIASQVLAHRAKCRLVLSQPDKAIDDLTLLHHLNLTLVKSSRSTTLVAAMIHTAITLLYVDAVNMGLDTHAWRESDLAALQQQFAEIHLISAVGASLGCERAGLCHMLDSDSTDELVRHMTIGVSPGTGRGPDFWFILPGGWIYQNKAVIATLEDQMLASLDMTNETVSPRLVKTAQMRTTQALRHVTPYNFFAAIGVPNYVKATLTTARNQTWVDQAQIVCALERYRLANGKYPASLTALVPRFLDKIPHDVINGKPMNYVLQSDQRFLLYSVGWNEVDDGGITARNSDGTEDRENADWVWHSPVL